MSLVDLSKEIKKSNLVVQKGHRIVTKLSEGKSVGVKEAVGLSLAADEWDSMAKHLDKLVLDAKLTRQEMGSQNPLRKAIEALQPAADSKQVGGGKQRNSPKNTTTKPRAKDIAGKRERTVR